MTRLTAACLSLGLFAIAASHADAASFDCGKATSPGEKRICDDSILSRLDESLAQSYKKALDHAADKAALMQEQRQWVREKRDPSSWSVPGLRSVYEDRILELDISYRPRTEGTRGLIVGNWEAGSRAFEDDVLLVGQGVLTYRSTHVDENCVAIPYTVVLEREGHGPGGPGAGTDMKGMWSEVAIELHPMNAEQRNGCKARIFDFSITREMPQHADLCIAESLEVLRSGNCSAWGVFGRR